MSDATTTITCSHGETAACFVCCHLVGRSRRRGFVHSDEHPLDPWPDAWCGACDRALKCARGRWSRALEERADVKAVCGHCWDDAFLRNAPLRSARRTALYLQAACRGLDARQQAWLDCFQVRDWPRFGWGQDGVLTFGSARKVAVRCRSLVAGTWGRRSQTWLWSWANPAFARRLRQRLVRVKRFGESQGLAPLVRSMSPATEEEAWHLAALAANILGAQGIYRVPTEGGSMLLLVFGTKRVAGPSRSR